MKTTTKIALFTLMSASLAVPTFAQGRRPAGPPPQHPPIATGTATTPTTPPEPPAMTADRAADMASHLADLYAELRLADTDHDAKLNEAEQAALAKEIVAGTFHPGPPRPEGAPAHTPSAEHAAEMAANLADAYGKITVYDKDRDGKLNDAEQAEVAKAILAGTLDLPHHGPGGPGGPGGADRAAFEAKLLETYDTNKDGKLDAAERAVIAADIKSGKLQPPAHGGRPGGPRGPRN